MHQEDPLVSTFMEMNDLMEEGSLTPLNSRFSPNTFNNFIIGLKKHSETLVFNMVDCTIKLNGTSTVSFIIKGKCMEIHYKIVEDMYKIEMLYLSYQLNKDQLIRRISAVLSQP